MHPNLWDRFVYTVLFPRTLEHKFWLGFSTFLVLLCLLYLVPEDFGLLLGSIWVLWVGQMAIFHSTTTVAIAVAAVVSIPAYYLGGPAASVLAFLLTLVFLLAGR